MLEQKRDGLRWEDTDLSRTLVCLKQTCPRRKRLPWRSRRLCKTARSRGAWRARGARALVRMFDAFPAPLRPSLRSGPPLARTRPRHVASKGISLHTNCMLSRLGVHVHAVTRCCWRDGCTSLRKVFSIIAVGEILLCLCSLRMCWWVHVVHRSPRTRSCCRCPRPSPSP